MGHFGPDSWKSLEDVFTLMSYPKIILYLIRIQDRILLKEHFSVAQKIMKSPLRLNNCVFFKLFFLLALAPTIYSDELDVNENSTFCFVGDTGEINPTQKAVAEALAASECNAIWHTGDIIYPDGIASEQDPSFTTNFLKPFEKVLDKGIPFFLSLGNHDYKKEPKSYQKIAKTNSLIVFPNNYYLKNFGQLCVLTLDTTIFDKLYLFLKRTKQTDWVNSQKERMKQSCGFSIAIGHHPFFSSGDRKNASPQLSSFLDKNIFGSFDLYISGHNHVLADEGERKGTRQLISGTGSLPGGSPDEQPEGKFNVQIPGFLKLKITKSNNAVVGEYSFVQAKDQEIIWRSRKIGQGIRDDN